MNRNQGAAQAVLEGYVIESRNVDPTNKDRVRRVQLAIDTCNDLVNLLDGHPNKDDGMQIVQDYRDTLNYDGEVNKDIEAQITACLVTKSRIEQLN